MEPWRRDEPGVSDLGGLDDGDRSIDGV